MGAQENKDVVRRIYTAMAQGDMSVFVEHTHADYVWRISGQSSWSGSYVGREAIRRELIEPLFARFAGRYRARVHHLIAEGDFVVAQATGDVETKEGARYDNQYCFVFKFRDGKVAELIEYADTDLGERVLGPYAAAVAAVQKI